MTKKEKRVLEILNVFNLLGHFQFTFISMFMFYDIVRVK